MAGEPGGLNTAAEGLPRIEKVMTAPSNATRPPRRCNRKPQISQDEFLRRAREKHGDRYGYEHATFAGITKTVTIVCSEHGEFEQNAGRHMSGQGCPKCGRENQRAALRMGFAEFERRAREIHNDRYDYIEQEWVDTLTQVTIVCSKHGPFQQTPNNHLYRPAGCPKCRNEAHADRSRLTMPEFLALARSHHGDKYDYSLVDYKTAMIAVTIICPDHGKFEQVPNLHLRGAGCWECYNDGRWLTRDEFVERATAEFDGRYDYSNVPDGFVATRSKVPVVCPKHGEFMAYVVDHLRGRGCLACRESRQEAEIRSILEEAEVEFVTQFSHPALRYKNPLRFDFAIPSTRTLIEYDGIFHYQVVTMNGRIPLDEAERALAETQLRDGIKDQWAWDNGWTLHRLRSPRRLRAQLERLGVV